MSNTGVVVGPIELQHIADRHIKALSLSMKESVEKAMASVWDRRFNVPRSLDLRDSLRHAIKRENIKRKGWWSQFQKGPWQ